MNNDKQTMMPWLLAIFPPKLGRLIIIASLLLTSACQARDQITPKLAAESTVNVSRVTETNKPSADSNTDVKAGAKGFAQDVPKTGAKEDLKITQTRECPIISSTNWSATVVINNQGESKLSISGDVELPNPGYAVTFERAIVDRQLTPKLHFTIKTERLSGFYIQAITPMSLEHSAPEATTQYRSIVIHCGEQIIATIDGAQPSD